MAQAPHPGDVLASPRAEVAGDLVIGRADPLAPDVTALLERHLAFARNETPAEHVCALEPAALIDPDVDLFGARRGGTLVATGALRSLESGHAELKSMHTALEERGRGIGQAMVEHLLAEARARGCRRVSLETGTSEAFAPARRLYERAGFRRCPPFNGYTDNPYSICMTLELPGDEL